MHWYQGQGRPTTKSTSRSRSSTVSELRPARTTSASSLGARAQAALGLTLAARHGEVQGMVRSYSMLFLSKFYNNFRTHRDGGGAPGRPLNTRTAHHEHALVSHPLQYQGLAGSDASADAAKHTVQPGQSTVVVNRRGAGPSFVGISLQRRNRELL